MQRCQRFAVHGGNCVLRGDRLADRVLRNPRFIEQVGFQNVLIGYWRTRLLVSLPFPFWSMRWWIKNAHLASDDEEFQNDRNMVKAAGRIAIASLVTFGALLCLVVVLKTSMVSPTVDLILVYARNWSSRPRENVPLCCESV